MASDKNIRAFPNERKIRYHSLIRNEHSFSGTMSVDDAVATPEKRVGIPKFLRTQSSSVILPSPRKSRSAARFLSNLMPSSTSDTLSEKSSVREKNRNYSSLNNLSRLMSPSSRRAVSALNQSKSLRSVDHVIDENTEFRASYKKRNARNNDSNTSVPNLLDLNTNGSRSTSRLALYRTNHFRRRSISWDSSQNSDPHIRYAHVTSLFINIEPIRFKSLLMIQIAALLNSFCVAQLRKS